ncbi:MAG: hypothetical protein LC731_03220, partial [Acidobacteria bacterium]|nr:hypothetical protein [Acidobacteriota bacterium]
MPVTDPDERAKRAIALAIEAITPDFVEVTKNDTNDPTPDGFAFTPEDLFDLTFDDNRVNITNQTLIRGFVKALRQLLPEISAQIQEDLGGLEPGVSILSVFNVIRGELGEVGFASKGMATRGTSRSLR